MQEMKRKLPSSSTQKMERVHSLIYLFVLLFVFSFFLFFRQMRLSSNAITDAVKANLVLMAEHVTRPAVSSGNVSNANADNTPQEEFVRLVRNRLSKAQKGSLSVSVCLSCSLSVWLSVCHAVCVSACLSIMPSECLSV